MRIASKDGFFRRPYKPGKSFFDYYIKDMLMNTRIKNQYMPVRAYWIARVNLFRQNGFFCSNCGYQSDEALGRCPECDANMEDTGFGPAWLEQEEPFDTLFAD